MEKIRETIALLHSMVLSGEKIDGTVSEMVKDSIEKIDNMVECKLWEADLEDNWIKFQVPAEVMAKGIRAGSVKIDLSDIQ